MNHSNLNESFGTLSETINGLISSGYTFDFNIKDECIFCQQKNIILSPEEFQIDKAYRFEGESNPDDEAIVYAISSDKFGIKGTLVNGYGISADAMSAKLISKLESGPLPITFKSKYNISTPQRPEGHRNLDAPLVEIDPDKFIIQIKSEPAWSRSDHNSVTLFKSESMRIVLMGLHSGAELKPHKANGVISVQVVKGKVEFLAEEQSSIIEKGQMIALHENITHSVLAIEESFFLLTIAMKK